MRKRNKHSLRLRSSNEDLSVLGDLHKNVLYDKLIWFVQAGAKRWHIGRALFLVGLLLVSGAAFTLQSQSPHEHQIKAAFLYNFAKFIEWPSDAFPYSRGSLVIGIVGEDPFGSELDRAISSKMIDGRRLVVKRMKRSQDLEFCHLLFISSSEKGRLERILAMVKGSSTLTVGEVDRFTQLGGIIKFNVKHEEIHFEIHLTNARGAGLKISSKLLRLAEAVY